MKKARTYPPLMSHEDRRRLIEAPIVFTYIAGAPHAGTLIDRDWAERVMKKKADTSHAGVDHEWDDVWNGL